jgi:hypothetical protein
MHFSPQEVSSCRWCSWSPVACWSGATTKGSSSLDPKEFPDLQQYAGQQVVNGEQAKAFANGFIRRHLAAASNGKTYSELSTEARANPSDQKLAASVQTAFRGETLRGMLLNAYAFWQMAQVALFAAIGAFIAAALMLLLTVLGFLHLRRTPPAAVVGQPVSTLTNA